VQADRNNAAGRKRRASPSRNPRTTISDGRDDVKAGPSGLFSFVNRFLKRTNSLR
jgi:hypothetical protein